MAPMLLNIIVKKALATLALQLDIFLDGEEILHDSVDFASPFERVQLRMQYLVLFSLLKQLLLLLVATWVEKANFSLFNLTLRDFAA